MTRASGAEEGGGRQPPTTGCGSVADLAAPDARHQDGEHMLNLGMRDALSIWSELEQAWHRTNGFGTDTAEIYAFRVAKASPSVALGDTGSRLGREAQIEYADEVARNLGALLALFVELRECRIEVDGKLFDPKVGVEPFTHRVHVKVTREDSRRRR